MVDRVHRLQVALVAFAGLFPVVYVLITSSGHL